jgi:hypothetical protein
MELGAQFAPEAAGSPWAPGGDAPLPAHAILCQMDQRRLLCLIAFAALPACPPTAAALPRVQAEVLAAR